MFYIEQMFVMGNKDWSLTFEQSIEEKGVDAGNVFCSTNLSLFYAGVRAQAESRLYAGHLIDK